MRPTVRLTGARAQHALVAAQAAGPPLLCPDGDPAGRKAAVASWVQEMIVAGHEVVVITLSDAHDPAPWLELHGADRLGCHRAQGLPGRGTR